MILTSGICATSEFNCVSFDKSCEMENGEEEQSLLAI